MARLRDALSSRWFYAALAAVAAVLLCVLALLQAPENPATLSGSLRQGGIEPDASEAARPRHGTPAVDEEAVAGTKRSARLSGTVVDEGGQAVPGALVKLVGPLIDALPVSLAGNRGESLTDDRGRFQFAPPLPSGVYRLRATAEAYQDTETQVQLTDQEDLVIELVLKRGCVVAGKVIHQDGRPAAGINVTASCQAAAVDGRISLSGSSHMVGPTGADGAFCLSNLEPGECRLGVALPAGDGARRGQTAIPLTGPGPESLLTLELSPGEQRRNVTITLPIEARQGIAGRVVTESGVAIAGAKVTVTRTGNEDRGLAAPVTTKDDGTFYVAPIKQEFGGKAPERPVTVQCEAQGYEPALVQSVPRGTTDLTITLAHRSRGNIEGVVLHKGTGKPVTGARVVLWQVYTSWGDRWRPNMEQRSEEIRGGRGAVDERGEFRLVHVPAGTATIQVYAEGFGPSLHGGIQVSAQQTTRVTISLEAAGTLQVRVIPSGPLTHPDSRLTMEVIPADQLSYEDDRPLPCPGATFTPSGGSGYSEPSAGLRFARDLRAWGCAEEVSEQGEDGTRTRVLTLAPGTYTVRVSMRYQGPREQMRGPAPVVYREAQATVRSGQVTAIDVRVGGESAIEGSVATLDSESNVQVILVPGDSVQAIADCGADSGITSDALIVPAFGEAAFVRGAGSRGFRFDAVAPGTYTVAAYAQGNADGAFRLVGARTLVVREGASEQVDLP